MLPLPLAIRLALKLHEAWAAPPQTRCDASRTWRDLDAILAEARRLQNQIRLAARHQLALLLPRLTAEMPPILDNLVREAEQLRTEFAPATHARPVLAEWVKEVRQLEAEFGAVEVRWSDRIVRVVTERIELGEVDLGPFAIEFGWGSARLVRGARSFEAIALEPHPAASREDVVHPHVEGRRLCAGDAAEPLRQALDAGCLTDAFLIVRSVLVTYNANSAYVPLADWDGFSCSECGRRANSQERFNCERCESSLCDECSSSCTRCSETHCSDCLEPCAVCRDRHCSDCLTETASTRTVCRECRVTCPACDAAIATDERHPDTGLCAACSNVARDENPSPEPLESTHAP